MSNLFLSKLEVVDELNMTINPHFGSHTIFEHRKLTSKSNPFYGSLLWVEKAFHTHPTGLDLTGDL